MLAVFRAPGGSASGLHSSGIIAADAGGFGTDWYPRSGISPAEVNSSDFGQLFDVTLPPVGSVPAGQVYAEPLAADGVLLVVTENDNAYGLDPANGAVEWSRSFGAPWESATINCGDLAPSVGITGTPVIDSATGVAYFVTDTTPPAGGAEWQMQAVDMATGAEAAGFPVEISGGATNDPGREFDPVYEMQRPGLTLVNGEVYATFGAHCDESTWYGWIAGVTTSGVLSELWVDETGDADGAGLWGPGGIDVDSNGNLYVATGNGGLPDPGPADPTGAPGFGECVLELSTGGPSLEPTDYFCPSDAVTLNGEDGDLGSGSPVLLPSSFGTAAEANLLVEDGKSGEVYLLDRDDLGGYENGPGGSDDVVSESGPRGGTWSHPAVWPGDGGYVYIVTANPVGTGRAGGEIDVYEREVTDGNVSLNFVGTGGDDMKFGSGIPVVTSDGTEAGSAVVWDIVRLHSARDTAKLEAFGAVPVPGDASSPSGTLPLLFEASAGNSTKFSEPLVYDRRIYLANFDGQVRCYGRRRAAPPLAAAAVAEPDTVLGDTASASATITASGKVTVTGLSMTVSTPGAAGAFTAAPLAAPVHLRSGRSLSVPVTFAPQVVGGQQGTLTVDTSHGTLAVPVSGRGVPEGVPIAATPPAVKFATQPIGGAAVSVDVSFENTSSAPLTVESVGIESGASAPFGVGTLPDPLPTLAAGASLTVPVQFTPPATSGDFVQHFSDHLVVDTTAGESSVPLAGAAAPPPELAISSLSVSVGTVAVGQSGIASFLVSNRGGTPLTITKSKPPVSGGLSAVTTLAEGTVIGAHRSVVETVRFSPLATGRAHATWVLNGSDSSGYRTVRISGTGADERVAPPPQSGSWSFSGSAVAAARGLVLTRADPRLAGASFLDHPVTTRRLRASFDLSLTGGPGRGGVTFALAAGALPGAPGRDGGGLGLAGLGAVGVGFELRPSAANPVADSIGIVTSSPGSGGLRWSDVVASPQPLEAGPVAVTVVLGHGSLEVFVDGFLVTSGALAAAGRVHAGFTGATGGAATRQLVSSVQLSYG